MVPTHGEQPSTARILCDRQDCIPLTKILSEDDVILILTPVVVPLEGHDSSADPFEPLGRALAARHGKVRNVPYTKRSGITETHVAFIKRARVVIFVISGMPAAGEPSQADFAEVARIISEHRPQVVLACCNIQSGDLPTGSFPTIVQISQYSPQELQAAAALLFGDSPAIAAVPVPTPTPVAAPAPTPAPAPVAPTLEAPRHWKIREWNSSEMAATFDLWNQCLPPKFQLPRQSLLSLLDRSGWSKHFIVRDPADPQRLVGFCATYMSFKASSSEDLVGSLAVLVVRPGYRRRGIGWSLHGHALRHLKGVRGVRRIQLGSTFPRLLYGPPNDFENLDWDWFARRGWTVGAGLAGQGQEMCDWVVKFEDLPKQSFAPAGLTFRPCEYVEIPKVLSIVEIESARQDTMGWFDQYANLKGTEFVESNIIVCLEGDRMVAAALVYMPDDGSPNARDLPWAAKLGRDTGGVSCICIADHVPGIVNSRDVIMIRLLDACIRRLAEHGMEKLFIDAVRGGNEGFQSIGFQKWASYRDIWKNVNTPGIQWPFDSY